MHRVGAAQIKRIGEDVTQLDRLGIGPRTRRVKSRVPIILVTLGDFFLRRLVNAADQILKSN